jgi:hypothetical protein
MFIYGVYLSFEFGAVVIVIYDMFHCKASRYPNLIKDCMDPVDRHELVVVETDGITVIETRCRFSVPFHTASWFCAAEVSHSSQVSE